MNTDIYGIGVALHTAFEIYLRSARGEGKSTHLKQVVRDGDTVLFISHEDAKTFKREIGRSKDVKTVVVNVSLRGEIDLARNRESLFTSGDIHFDHRVIELIYERSIKSVQGYLNGFVDHYSRKPETEHHPVMKTANKWRL